MITMASISTILSQTGTIFKTTIAIAALIAALSVAYTTGQAMVNIPAKLARHDSITIAGFRSLDKLLCINVADHRKIDWRMCYINPSEVLPIDYQAR